MRPNKTPEDMLDEAPTFENVARIIAESDADVPWLADALRAWVWGDERHFSKEASRQGAFATGLNVAWSREALVRHFSETPPQVVNTLVDMLGDYTQLRLLAAAGPGFGRDELASLASALQDLHWRCPAASRSPELVSQNGKKRRGRGKVSPIGLGNEKVECACTVRVAWAFVRNKPPGSENQHAALVAERLLALGMVEVGRFDLVKQRKPRRDYNTLNAWRRHFDAAKAPTPWADQYKETLLVRLRSARDEWR
jgi:hypothetical protein